MYHGGHRCSGPSGRGGSGRAKAGHKAAEDGRSLLIRTPRTHAAAGDTAPEEATNGQEDVKPEKLTSVDPIAFDVKPVKPARVELIAFDIKLEKCAKGWTPCCIRH